MKPFESGISALPTTRSSVLRVVPIWNQLILTGTINIVIRQIVDGKFQNSYETIDITLISRGQELRYKLTDGYLVGVAITTPSTNLPRGSFFVTAYLDEDSLTNSPRSQQLTSGYIDGWAQVNFPNSRNDGYGDGTYELTLTALAEPTPGTELTYTIDQNDRSIIEGGSFLFTTDATAANRTVNVDIIQSTVAIQRLVARSTQTASLAVRYFLWKGENIPTDTGLYKWIPLPQELELTDATITTNTTNLQGGDTYTEPCIRHRCWPCI